MDDPTGFRADMPNAQGRMSVNQRAISPQFLTVDELASMLRVKKRTVYEWVSREAIPFRKAGDRTIFLLDEILDWTLPPDRNQN